MNSFLTLACAVCLTVNAAAVALPQQSPREGEIGYSLQEPAELPSQLYNTPTVPPPPTVPTLAPQLPPSPPDQLYSQPQQSGDASDNTGAILFPDLQNPAPAPPPPTSQPPQPPATRPTTTTPSAMPQGILGMPYEFEWGVNDLESGNVFSHSETSDGNVAMGSYRVLLPDGRLQIVEFVDRGRGFEATVRYEDYAAGRTL